MAVPRPLLPENASSWERPGIKHTEQVAMYPSYPSINLRGFEGAYVQTSLSWAFPHNRQIGLSLIVRSTFSSK